MVPMDRASNNVVIVCKRYYVVVILNKIGVIGHRNHTYFKINESCDEIINENTEYANVLSLKSQKKQKDYQSCTAFLNGIRIQQVHVS